MGRGVFDIDIFKLANGSHSFKFNFDSSFFDLFEDSLIQKGQGQIEVELARSSLLITLVLNIEAEVELVCDRSLDTFMYSVNTTNEVRLKFGDHSEELSDDLYIISANTQKVDIGQFAYEFMSLAVPMKKIHPRFKNDADEGIIFTATDLENESSNNNIDPRWNELKKIKKN